MRCHCWLIPSPIQRINSTNSTLISTFKCWNDIIIIITSTTTNFIITMIGTTTKIVTYISQYVAHYRPQSVCKRCKPKQNENECCLSHRFTMLSEVPEAGLPREHHDWSTVWHTHNTHTHTPAYINDHIDHWYSVHYFIYHYIFIIVRHCFVILCFSLFISSFLRISSTTTRKKEKNIPFYCSHRWNWLLYIKYANIYYYY